MPSYVEAACIIFPTGEIYWCNAHEDETNPIIDRWVRENPRHHSTVCTMAVAAIKMLKEDFEKVKGWQGPRDNSPKIWMPPQ
jgi:hypothetical protein